jgi:3-oxoacyl-[acyl-carrier-protein] synthase-1
MSSFLIHADTRCALGTSFDEAVTALLSGQQQQLQQVAFDDLGDPVTLPYYTAPGFGDKNQEQRIYHFLRDMLEDALDRCPLSDSERAATGLFIGSSSFDINVSETLYSQELETSTTATPLPIIGYGKIAADLQESFGLSPHAYTYSTACTSSANALLSAHRLLKAGVISHAFVMGVEFFNRTTLLGFHGLSLISASGRLSPFEARRDGLILGEGCGLLMLSATKKSDISLCGGATATDNHNLTAANGDGSTIAHVMGLALDNCELQASQLKGIKLHGTASLMNDEAEAAGIRMLQRPLPPLFALKPYIGHTLGACGVLEAALVYGCLRRGRLPGNAASGPTDERLGVSLLPAPRTADAGYYALNYFAFGGNNTCLILCKAAL